MTHWGLASPNGKPDLRGTWLAGGAQVGWGVSEVMAAFVANLAGYYARYLRLGMAASMTLLFNLEAPEHFGLKKSFNFPTLDSALDRQKKCQVDITNRHIELQS